MQRQIRSVFESPWSLAGREPTTPSTGIQHVRSHEAINWTSMARDDYPTNTHITLPWLFESPTAMSPFQRTAGGLGESAAQVRRLASSQCVAHESKWHMSFTEWLALRSFQAACSYHL